MFATAVESGGSTPAPEAAIKKMGQNAWVSRLCPARQSRNQGLAYEKHERITKKTAFESQESARIMGQRIA
jgi:hypothetical protein